MKRQIELTDNDVRKSEALSRTIFVHPCLWTSHTLITNVLWMGSKNRTLADTATSVLTMTGQDKTGACPPYQCPLLTITTYLFCLSSLSAPHVHVCSSLSHTGSS